MQFYTSCKPTNTFIQHLETCDLDMPIYHLLMNKNLTTTSQHIRKPWNLKNPQLWHSYVKSLHLVPHQPLYYKNQGLNQLPPPLLHTMWRRSSNAFNMGQCLTTHNNKVNTLLGIYPSYWSSWLVGPSADNRRHGESIVGEFKSKTRPTSWLDQMVRPISWADWTIDQSSD